MEIYYNCVEGGNIKPFHESVSFDEAIAELTAKRVADEETRVSFSSIRGCVVHSVFFVENGVVKIIWDSFFNGMRPINSIIPLPK